MDYQPPAAHIFRSIAVTGYGDILMGLYRLLLSMAVLLSHLGVDIHGVNQGVIAVISFFVISGYTMTALIDKYYLSNKNFSGFYIDRVARLFPQFLFYGCVTYILILIFKINSIFLSDLTLATFVMNMTMLPLNFFPHFLHSQIVPPAWSLGLESQFYIFIAPIIFFRIRMICFVGSIIFFLFAYVGVIDSDVWAYRMIPGTIFIFLCGSYIFRKEYVWILLVIGTACAGLIFGFATRHFEAQILEVLIGLILGILAVVSLGRRDFGRFDRILGNLSYGVFLNHFFVIWTLQAMHISGENPRYILFIIAGSLILSYFSFSFVEKPVMAWRKKFRRSETGASQ